MEGKTGGEDDLVWSTARDYILLWGEEGTIRESGVRQERGMEIVGSLPVLTGIPYTDPPEEDPKEIFFTQYDLLEIGRSY